MSIISIALRESRRPRSAVAGPSGVMVDRRLFLKLTGLVAAASALRALPVWAERRPEAAAAERADDLELASLPSVARLTIGEPGTYRISGRVRLEEIRPGVYQAVVTAHELSALLAGARMSLALMDEDPTGVTDEARRTLASVLDGFDAALARARQAGEGRGAGPTPAAD